MFTSLSTYPRSSAPLFCHSTTNIFLPSSPPPPPHTHILPISLEFLIFSICLPVIVSSRAHVSPASACLSICTFCLSFGLYYLSSFQSIFISVAASFFRLPLVSLSLFLSLALHIRRLFCDYIVLLILKMSAANRLQDVFFRVKRFNLLGSNLVTRLYLTPIIMTSRTRASRLISLL